MVVTSLRQIVRRLLVDADASDLAAERSPEDRRVLSLMVAAVFSQLVARLFATSDDLRIEPFLARVWSEYFMPPGVSPDMLKRLIRATLGDQSQRRHLPAGQIAGMQICMSIAIMTEVHMTDSGLEELLDGAERLVVVWWNEHGVPEGVG